MARRDHPQKLISLFIFADGGPQVLESSFPYPFVGALRIQEPVILGEPQIKG